MSVVHEQHAASKDGAKQLHWKEEEDEFLCKALAKYGLKNWDRVTRLLPYRTFKAVQNRWFNYIEKLPNPHFKRLRKIYEDQIKKVTDDAIQKLRDEKQKRLDDLKAEKEKEAIRLKIKLKEEQLKKKADEQARMQQLYNQQLARASVMGPPNHLG